MRHRIRPVGELIAEIQQAFLDSPGVALTPADVQHRWHLPRTGATALLHVLADAGVLAGDINSYAERGT